MDLNPKILFIGLAVLLLLLVVMYVITSAEECDDILNPECPNYDEKAAAEAAAAAAEQARLAAEAAAAAAAAQALALGLASGTVNDGMQFPVDKYSPQNYIYMNKEHLKLIDEYIRRKLRNEPDAFVCANSQTLKIYGIDGNFENSSIDGTLITATHLDDPLQEGDVITLGVCNGEVYVPPAYDSTDNENTVKVVAMTPYHRSNPYINNYIGIPTVEKGKVGEKMCINGVTMTVLRKGDLDQEGLTYIYFTELMGERGASAMNGEEIQLGECT